MKIVIIPFRKSFICVFLVSLFLSAFIRAQQPITSIITNNITNSQVSYPAIKGAGLRNPSNTLISYWDSTSTYNVNYNVPATANILRLSQFFVGSFSSSLITAPTNAFVKIRRSSNPDVGDARNYYNFWAQYSSIPNPSDISGTFNFTAPEVLNPEDAFLLNNLTSGYDNIFQNTIANPHFGNIERIDFIMPSGLKTYSNIDRTESGIAIIDRGTGDPFKIALITAVDVNNVPTAFGNLVSVTAANFGGNLLSTAIDYAIMINDVKYNSESRPSTRSTQNLRGVYISLADLGLVNNQAFFGYALFGPDVTIADPDWTTYPNNTSGGSQLDPVNIMGLYKSGNSLLPLSISFTAARINKVAQLDFTLYNKLNSNYFVVQRSADGINFKDLNRLHIEPSGTYTFIDNDPLSGMNYYRLKMIEKDGNASTSETRLVKFENKPDVSIYPNPAAEQLNINIPPSWAGESVTAEIFTSTGQLVKHLQFERTGTRQTIMLNNTKPGTYILRLVRKDLSSSQINFTVL